jgi:TM2 domain-containing membrane protein YozV
MYEVEQWASGWGEYYLQILSIIVGIIVDSVDTYFSHKEYFDKLRERERWKKS